MPLIMNQMSHIRGFMRSRDDIDWLSKDPGAVRAANITLYEAFPNISRRLIRNYKSRMLKEFELERVRHLQRWPMNEGEEMPFPDGESVKTIGETDRGQTIFLYSFPILKRVWEAAKVKSIQQNESLTDLLRTYLKNYISEKK